MKTKHTLVRVLRVCCAIGEIVAVLGLLAVLFVLPFSDTLVRSSRATIGLYSRSGSIDWTFSARLPFGGRVSYLDAAASGEPRLGKVSFGPFRLRQENGPAATNAPETPSSSASVGRIEGVVTLEHPDEAAEAMASAKWPFAFSVLCTGAASLAVLELFRRMLKSVEMGEVFTLSNIQNVRKIGILLVASCILKAVAAAWLVVRMSALVGPHMAGGRFALESSSGGGLPGLATGLMILALAEVFRQGLTLKEESDLTI
jgi:hypothetical protein